MKKTALSILSILGAGAYTANAQATNHVTVNVRFHPIFEIIFQKTEHANTEHGQKSETIMDYLEINSTTCFQLTEHSTDPDSGTLLEFHQSPIKGLMTENINVSVNQDRRENKIYTLTPL